MSNIGREAEVSDSVGSQNPKGLDPEDDALDAILNGIALASARLARVIARGGIDHRLDAATGTNADGDAQKTLDVLADDLFREALVGVGVRHLVSEEQEHGLTLDPDGHYAVAIDPLDGSSNIDSNVSIGTIFGIYPAGTDLAASFLRPGRDLVAAGYTVYGPQCCLVIARAGRVTKLVLDPHTGAFVIVDDALKVPDGASEYAINASNYRYWDTPIRAYVDDLVAGAEGPRGKNFNMRWIASLVAETHRILVRGGIFLYPRDSRKGYEHGRLRYLYECAPIAFVIEAAGGSASDGVSPILSRTPASLHARCPLIFGAAEKVARVVAYHDLPERETSALFGRRGLFRD